MIFSLWSGEASKIYKDQWKVEGGFRTLKSSIEIRPMYVYKDEHIQAHLFLCLLSLIVIKYLIYKLKKLYKDNDEIQKLTMDMFLDALRLVTISIKWVNDKLVSTITDNSDPSHEELNKIHKDFEYLINL